MTRRILEHQVSKRLDLGEGDWVALKPRWTVFDRQAINDAMITMRFDTQAAIPKKARKGFRPGHDPREKVEEPIVKLNQSMNLYAGNVAAMKQGVVAWGGPGFCVRDHEDGSQHNDAGLDGCSAIAKTDEAIMAMDDETSTLIVQALDDMNPQVPSEEGVDEEISAPLSINGGDS